jgi:hypothetical protein
MKLRKTSGRHVVLTIDEEMADGLEVKQSFSTGNESDRCRS